MTYDLTHVARRPDLEGRTPRITVVVPALDEEAVLGRCLASLAEQRTSGRVEVVVVDNGSTDATAEVARRHGARVLHEPRPGVCHARQRGLLAATGEIVVSTDADTTFAPGWLQGIDDELRRDARVVGVAGPCAYVDGPWWSGVWTRLLFGAVSTFARATGVVTYVTATNLAFRRDAFEGYDTRLTQGGDELDALRRLRRRGRVVFVNRRATRTSARRLARGLAYSLVVSLGYHYLLGYLVNRVTGRTLLATAPAFRQENDRAAEPTPVAPVSATLRPGAAGAPRSLRPRR